MNLSIRCTALFSFCFLTLVAGAQSEDQKSGSQAYELALTLSKTIDATKNTPRPASELLPQLENLETLLTKVPTLAKEKNPNRYEADDMESQFRTIQQELSDARSVISKQRGGKFGGESANFVSQSLRGVANRLSPLISSLDMETVPGKRARLAKEEGGVYEVSHQADRALNKFEEEIKKAPFLRAETAEAKRILEAFKQLRQDLVNAGCIVNETRDGRPIERAKQGTH